MRAPLVSLELNGDSAYGSRIIGPKDEEDAQNTVLIAVLLG